MKNNKQGNYFYDLPKELQQMIYEKDHTYKDIMKEVFETINDDVCICSSCGKYCIIDEKTDDARLLVCDSLNIYIVPLTCYDCIEELDSRFENVRNNDINILSNEYFKYLLLNNENKFMDEAEEAVLFPPFVTDDDDSESD